MAVIYCVFIIALCGVKMQRGTSTSATPTPSGSALAPRTVPSPLCYCLYSQSQVFYLKVPVVLTCINSEWDSKSIYFLYDMEKALVTQLPPPTPLV